MKHNSCSKMFQVLFTLSFLCFLNSGEIVDDDDELMPIEFFCGVVDPYNVVGSRLVRVDPQPDMEINSAGIVDIENYVFKKCGGTLSLSMSDNKLAYLTGKRLVGLWNVMVLNLFSNFIEYVENGTFDGLRNLRELELSYNRLNGLDVGVRSGLRELRKLHLNKNPILLREDGFLGLSKLELLELTGANISTVPYGSFNGLGQLRRLDLSGNKLTSVSEVSFEALVQLEELDLSANRISRIYKDSFKGLTNLKYLWLNDNQIESLIAVEIFECIPNLKNLYLYKNPLVFLNVGVFKKMQSVQIEPGFVFEFAKNVKSNFFNEVSSTYRCSQLHDQIGAKNADSESIRQDFAKGTSNDYYAPYYCDVLATDESINVMMI